MGPGMGLDSYVITSDGPSAEVNPQMGNEKNPGWLGYIGDETTQLYRGYNKPWHKDPVINQTL